jgi:hypothetical protein
MVPSALVRGVAQFQMMTSGVSSLRVRQYAFYCHCSRCRRRTGAACAAIGGIAADKVRITQGDEYVLKLNESTVGYVCVCKLCCSPLFATVSGGERIHVPLGVLHGAPSRAPDHHLHVASKAACRQITDGLPQFAELPP